MFGCICSGRPVQTNLQAISPSQFVFVLPGAESINHIVIFLLPDTILPEGHAATVYLQWPGREFQLLGGLSMQKQSAIFRIKGNHSAPGFDADAMTEDAAAISGGVAVQLGISIEPLAQVQAQLATLQQDKQSSAEPAKHKTLTHARKIIENAFNYLSSFSQGPPGHEVVPMKAFQEWWNKFQKKIEFDPGFLDREDS